MDSLVSSPPLEGCPVGAGWSTSKVSAAIDIVESYRIGLLVLTTPSGCACHPSRGGEFLWFVQFPSLEGCPIGAGWSNTQFMDEVSGAFRRLRFFDVRTNGCAGTDDLLRKGSGNIGLLIEKLTKLDYAEGKLASALSNMHP